MSGTTSGRSELAAILDLAAQQDGPVRLLQPRDSETNEKGLFPSSEGKHGVYQKELLGTMLVEVLARPRMVKLTDKGIEVLVRNTPQDERSALVGRVSQLYLRAVITEWKRIAIAREEELLNKAIHEHFGELFTETGESEITELDAFKLTMARELALSWSEADTDDARKRLSYFLRMIGATPFEEKDTVVTFDALTHKPKSPLFKGDSALVLSPGWTLNPPNKAPIILLNAEVTAAA